MVDLIGERKIDEILELRLSHFVPFFLMIKFFAARSAPIVIYLYKV